MANLQDNFLSFYDDIQITSTKRNKLITSHKNLRTVVRNYFNKNHPDMTPVFFIQGSYKMGTTIRTKDDECDLDDGVYFIPKPNVAGNTLQNWVMEAVTGITDTKPIHKNKCIRVNYNAGYHIDLPIYIKDKYNNSEHPLLAVRDGEYQESDPREVVEWFKNKKSNNAQLVRLVSYLKVWSDNMPHKLCSGLVWTTLVVDNLFTGMSNRDDIAIVRTVERIYDALCSKFQCIVHGTPFDDMLADYDEDKKNRLLDYLSVFVTKGNKALDEKNKKNASKYWISLFGDRFNEADDILEEGESLDTLRRLAVSVTGGCASTTKAGLITSEDGVPNKPHVFYGEET